MNIPEQIMMIDPTTAPDATVACNGCTVCCRREIVALVPGDDPAKYDKAIYFDTDHPLTGERGVWIIPDGGDGACVYLGPNGCTIYNKRPRICRTFDCAQWAREIMRRWTRTERRRLMRGGSIDRETFAAGKARM